MNHAKLLGESFKALEENKLNLLYIEKQLILYTKGHFKDLGQMDYTTDLKYFACKKYGLYPEQVETRSIFHMVVTLYQKLIDHGYIRFNLEDYIGQLFRHAWLHYNEHDKISMKNIIEYMLAEIQGTSVKGMDLGKPDLTILTIYKGEN